MRCNTCKKEFKLRINEYNISSGGRKNCFECVPYTPRLNIKEREKRKQVRYEKKKRFMREYMREYKRNLRVDAIKALGGSCIACGYNKDFRGLEIDHINGNMERKSWTGWKRQKFYRDIIAKKRTDAQVLCGTCHNIKTFANGENGYLIHRID